MDIKGGLDLSEKFYWEGVRPILDERFGRMRHGAGLLDYGSEVLGFDDEMSRDHHWGPRVLLFLNEEDHERFAESLHDSFGRHLPYEIEGYPTNWSQPDPKDKGVQRPEAKSCCPINHRVEIHTVRGFFAQYLGVDIECELKSSDWLSFSEQRLCTVTTGRIYHDAVSLNEVRAQLSYYPKDVWLYMMAACWGRIGQDDHLMGRAGWVGDEVGSALIGARLTRDVMRLCFMMERRYAPYAKWFGRAFGQLECAEQFTPILQDIVHSNNWREREEHLVQAYERLAGAHNALGLTDPLPTDVTLFFGRPFKVIALRGFVQSLLEQIEDPAMKRIAERPLIGGLDLLSDNCELTEKLSWRPKIKALYE